ncbi:metallophosphoesterase [Paenibacillus chondroitinus]|uniref:Metallophosphoesterase n=1 Tax=Paenibacillus chondroitinus TaxID=59842 RepID=A0ABU6DKV1_9BACL|nr:metallophosphoesterase [Paenibacillus chondroitinus]MCY9657120.1 metallophosphoesterase [Paenibacillus anseongense]MEB4798403.1 metallophosphoesterase [Paenibacillus chondroitinus]
MRSIIISDIHGYHQTFKALLNHVSFDPVIDQLVLLGDYVDGGPASLEVIRLVQSLLEYPNVHALSGNHDELLLRWLDEEEYPLLKYTSPRVGGLQTIRSFCSWYQSDKNNEEARQYIKSQYANEINFLRSMPSYYEDDHHIFVHAGIDPKQKNWKFTSYKDYRWIRGRFYKHDGTLPVGKRIVFGHVSCMRLHKDEANCRPWFGQQIIGIDGGIKLGKCLNALIFENDEYTSVSMESRDH